MPFRRWNRGKGRLDAAVEREDCSYGAQDQHSWERRGGLSATATRVAADDGNRRPVGRRPSSLVTAPSAGRADGRCLDGRRSSSTATAPAVVDEDGRCRGQRPSPSWATVRVVPGNDRRRRGQPRTPSNTRPGPSLLTAYAISGDRGCRPWERPASSPGTMGAVGCDDDRRSCQELWFSGERPRSSGA
jgi:hypothetical protein